MDGLYGYGMNVRAGIASDLVLRLTAAQCSEMCMMLVRL